MDLTFALGILGVLQICFLPGILLSHGFRIPAGIRFVTAAFGLSLMFNYGFVFLMTALHCYGPLTVYGLLTVEGLLLWRISRPTLFRWGRLPYYAALRFSTVEPDAESFHTPTGWLNRYRQIGCYGLFVVGLGALVYYLCIFFNGLGASLTTWDGLISWNRWAIDWYQNQFPRHTWHYPQLLTANWSLSYMILQNPNLQLFIRGFMPLFSSFSLLLLLHLGYIRKEAGFFLAVPMLGYLLCTVIQPMGILFEYADIPAMFFALMGLYWLLLVREAETKAQVQRNVFLAAVFCAGTALTKQSGLYMAVLFPIFAYWLALRKTALLTAREKVRIVALSMAFLLVSVGGWYFYKEWQIYNQQDLTEIGMVQRVSHKDTLVYSIQRALMPIQPASQLLIALLLLVSLRTPLGFRLFILMILPYSLIWAAFFRYDARLASIIFPFIAINVGLGFQQVFPGSGQFTLPQVRLRTIRFFNGSHLTILSLYVVLWASSCYLTKPVLVHRNRESLRNAGEVEVNQAMYAFHRKIGFEGKILTPYKPLGILPVLKRYYKYCRSCNLPEVQTMMRRDGAIKYILVFNSCHHKYKGKVKAGAYKILMPINNTQNPNICLFQVMD